LNLTPSKNPPTPPLELDSKTMTKKLEKKLQQETIDSTWAKTAEIAFSKSLEKSHGITASTIMNSECRQIFCRIVVEYGSQQDFDHFLEEIPFISPWDTNVFLHIEENQGKLISIIFVSREKHLLPK